MSDPKLSEARRASLAHDRTSPQREDHAERTFRGAVVVADMAGYTRFTEALVSASADGIDQLGRTIERSFRDYAVVVEAHRGVMVTLAGDAIVAIWPFEPDGDVLATTRALACARQLMLTARGHSLSLHAGVAAGELWAGSCAGFERDVDSVYGGAAMRAACRAAHDAEAGELRLGDGIVDVLGRFNAERIASAESSVELSGMSANRPGNAELWNAELRDVAALFIRWNGFDESSSGAWRRQLDALRLAQETTGTSGASGRLVIDQHGLVFVAVFGEPGSARLETESVIIERASVLLDRLQREHGPIAAGIVFGRVFCGDIDSPNARRKVSVGPALNIAARLMDHAGGGLLVAGISADRAPSWLVAQAEPLMLRGVSRPVHVFRYESGARQPPQVVLFDREEELARIASLLASVSASTGFTCLIRADAGIGKSALLAMVEAQAAQRGLIVVRGAARTDQRSAPYFLWRQILRDLVPETVAGELSVLTDHLEQLKVDPALAPLLNPILSVGFPESTISEGLTGKARAEATLELLFTLIKQAVRAPMLISIEDVHSADSASLELVERVALQLSNLILVVTARPAESTSELIYRLSGPRYHQFDLKPLTRTGIEAMLASELRGPSAPSLVDCIQEASRGNALFALEYLRLLSGSGRVANDGGSFHLAQPLDQSTIPRSVVGAVSSRIHALHPREQQLLKIASVLGPSFSRELLLDAAMDYETPELDTVLSNLERNGLMVQRSLRGDAVGFAHELVRDAAYDTMLHEQKRRVHAEVGRILENRREHHIRSLLPGLVHHHASAGDDARVVKYGELAAIDAIKQGAYNQAIDILRMCLDSAAKLPKHTLDTWTLVRWHRWLAEAAGAIGDLHARREYALKALQLSGLRLAGSPFFARIAILWNLVRRIVQRAPALMAELPEAAGNARQVEVAHALHELAFASYFSGERDWFLYYVLRALRHAERGGDLPQLIQISSLAGACIGYFGLERTGRKYMAVASMADDASVHEQAAAAGHMSCALYLIGRGAWHEVKQHLDRCQSLSLQLGSNYLWGNAQIIRFWLHWYRGERADAERAAQELLSAAERSGNRQHLRWSHRSLSLVRRGEGDLERAHAHMERARSLLADDADLNEVVQVMGAAAELHFARGELDDAEALATRTLDRLLRAPPPTGHAILEACSGIACVMMNLWQQEPNDLERKRRARQAVRVLQNYSSVFPIGSPRFQYWRSRQQRILGRRRAAAAALRRARKIAQQLRVAYDLTMVGERSRDSRAPGKPS